MNLAPYLTQPALGFLAALACSLLITCRVARRYFAAFISRERKVGKERIHRLYPRPRKPMGGGVGILLAIALALLLVARPFDQLLFSLLVLALASGAVGLLDDLRKAGGAGMGQRQKLAVHVLLFLAYAAYLHWRWGYGDVFLPFVGTVALGWGYLPVAALVLVAATNSVNLADGIDGLAGGSVAIACLFYLGLGLLTSTPTVALLAAVTMGACLGFLAYNLPPARMLMGDTGALALGTLLGAMALVSRTEWLLIPVGAVFVVDALSVLAQTGTIRLLRGPLRLLRYQTTEVFRPFLCTPIHHHFQWLAWPEWRILELFWGMAAVGGALAAGAALWSPWCWVLALLGMAGFLAASSAQKLLRAGYFLGFLPSQEGERQLAVFQGLPIDLFGRRLYRVARLTPLTERAVSGMSTADLWRASSEIEIRAVLGGLYADRKLSQQAVQEWADIPPRNLLLRENVLLQLARIYYSRGQLLQAIQLWERLPAAVAQAHKLDKMVRLAKVRLADLASKSYRQSMRAYQQFRDQQPTLYGQQGGELADQLTEARQLSADLLSLLVYEREKVEAPGSATEQPAAARQRTLFKRMERTVLTRITQLERALGHADPTAAPRPVPSSLPATPRPVPEDRATEEACAHLAITTTQLGQSLGGLGYGPPTIRHLSVSRKGSRNAIYRLTMGWSGPDRIIAKAYDDERITFFSACYRRERGILELLKSYGAAVPQVYGGVSTAHRALLFMEDCGRHTLRQLLAQRDEALRAEMLEAAVEALVDLHGRARGHLAQLQQEILKVDKESLNLNYYLSTLGVAVSRLRQLTGRDLPGAEQGQVQEAFRSAAELLALQPKTFVHFEFAPHHILVGEGQLVVFDFEQATLGPPEFDLMTLLRCPESDLSERHLEALVSGYHEGIRAFSAQPVPHRAPEAADYAALFKNLFYAGAAANFYRKFGGQVHLRRMEWYLRDCTALMARHDQLRELRRLLEPTLQRALSWGG